MGRDLPYYEEPSHPTVDAVGFAFTHGAAGGAAFHFVRGLARGSPGSGRLVSGVRAACTNAPRVAGAFAAFWTVSMAMDYAVCRARGVEESSGGTVATTAAFFGLVGMRRGGVPAAARYVLAAAAGMVVAAEICRFENMSDGASCLHQNQMRSGAKLDPAVLRPTPDAGRGEYGHWRLLAEDVAFKHDCK